MNRLTAGRKRVSRFTAPATGRLGAVSVFLDGRGDGSGPAQVVQFVVYSDRSGEPYARLGRSRLHTIRRGASARWVRLPLLQRVTLRAGRAYHLGVHSGEHDGVGRYGNASGLTGGMKQNDDALANGPSTRFGPTESIDIGLAARGHYAVVSVSPRERRRIAPVSTSRPRIVGQPRVGALVRATPGRWRASPTPTLTFRWQRCGRMVASCTTIAGATGPGYRVSRADRSKRLRVVVTAANTVRTVRRASALSRAVRAGAPARPSTPTPPAAHGLAHLWVHPQPSGSCTRKASPAAYDPATACPTAAAAYNAANRSAEGSLILIRGGQHPHFAIGGHRSSSNRIVFDAAPGEAPVFGEARLRVGLTLDRPQQAPKYVTIRNIRMAELGAGYPDPTSRFGLLVAPGSRFIRFENVSAGGFLVLGAKDVQLIGGDQGPCRRVGSNGGGFGPCETKADSYPGNCVGEPNNVCYPERILIDGVDIHDYNFDYGPGCSGACHWRPMYLNGVHGLTLRNSTIRNSVFEPWFTISGANASARGNHDILIENNQFGGSRLNGTGFAFAWCQNASSGVTAYANVVVRFNSFSRGMPLATPGSGSSAELGCRVSNFQVYGNIIGSQRGGNDGGRSCGVGVTWSHNVFAGAIRDTCGVGDRYIGGTTMPFYKDDTRVPTRGDYRLVGRRFAADNRVPVAAGCPAVDARGVKRPQNGGFCDAGAHER